ncbi:MAG TPA: hypothetical protein PKA98_19595, partial [Acidimicrobiales bacterium]|nr:hypothetical protein [Acidimicrobiales bacterium]
MRGIEPFVAAAVDLHLQHPASGVTKPDEPDEFGLVFRDARLVGDRGAALELRDVAALVDDEAAVLRVLEVEVASCGTPLRPGRLGAAGGSDVGEAGGLRFGGDGGKCGGGLFVEVSVRGDGQLVVSVHAACGGEVAEDV